MDRTSSVIDVTPPCPSFGPVTTTVPTRSLMRTPILATTSDAVDGHPVTYTVFTPEHGDLRMTGHGLDVAANELLKLGELLSVRPGQVDVLGVAVGMDRHGRSHVVTVHGRRDGAAGAGYPGAASSATYDRASMDDQSQLPSGSEREPYSQRRS